MNPSNPVPMIQSAEPETAPAGTPIPTVESKCIDNAVPKFGDKNATLSFGALKEIMRSAM